MSVRILYFAALAETLGLREEILPLPAPCSLAQLREQLIARGGAWQRLESRDVKAAINQDYAQTNSPVNPGDEIAFFPPVTGG